jgi:SAM-dependent methyltransferase
MPATRRGHGASADHYRETRAVFERTARLMDGFYDADANGPRQHTAWQRRVRALVGELSRATQQRAPVQLAELGCGRADLGSELLDSLPEGSCLCGFDFSPATLRIARRVATRGRARFALADLRHLPAADRRFDLTLLINVLHHVRPDDQPRVLQEAARITRHELIVQLNNGAHPYHRLLHPGVVLDGVRIHPTGLRAVARVLEGAGMQLAGHRGIWGPSWISPLIVARFER